MAQPPGRGTLLHTDPTSPTGMPLGSPGPQPVSGSATRAVVPALCLGGWLPALVPRNGGPNTFMGVIENHLREHLRDGNGPGKPKAAGEDEAQDERIDAAKKPPTHRFGNRPRVGVSSANEHLILPSSHRPRTARLSFREPSTGLAPASSSWSASSSASSVSRSVARKRSKTTDRSSPLLLASSV
jgi:hypothetical protein